MGTGRGKEKQRETELERKADTATAAVQPSAYQLYQQPKDLATLQAWDAGTDVKNIDAFRGQLDLFSNANRDDDFVGAGLLGNNALAGSNSGQLGLIAQQIKARREQQNQGNLYNAINSAVGDTRDRLQGFGAGDDSRNMFRAEQANQRYTSYLNRPRKPSIWETILGGAIQAGGQMGAAALMPA